MDSVEIALELFRHESQFLEQGPHALVHHRSYGLEANSTRQVIAVSEPLKHPAHVLAPAHKGFLREPPLAVDLVVVVFEFWNLTLTHHLHGERSIHFLEHGVSTAKPPNSD